MEQVYIIGFGRCGLHGQNFSGHADYTININSCGFWNNADSNNNRGGIFCEATGGTKIINIFNTWALDNSLNNSGDYNEQRNGAATIVWNISHCIDSDATIAFLGPDAGGDNLASRTLREATSGGDEVLVVDITTAPYDLTLVDDATNNDAQDVHTHDSDHGLTIISTDIAGTSRPQNTSHDIGPFEIVAAVDAADEDAGLFIAGQQQPVIEPEGAIPY